MTYPLRIETTFGALTLTHLMGGAPGWYMHSMQTTEDGPREADLRELGYERRCGWRERGELDADGNRTEIQIWLYERKYPLDIAVGFDR